MADKMAWVQGEKTNGPRGTTHPAHRAGAETPRSPDCRRAPMRAVSSLLSAKGFGFLVVLGVLDVLNGF